MLFNRKSILLERLGNQLYNKYGVCTSDPEYITTRKEQWESTSEEAKILFDIIANAPEEMYKMLGNNKKKGIHNKNISRIGVYIIRNYTRKRFGFTIKQAELVISETIYFAMGSLNPH